MTQQKSGVTVNLSKGQTLKVTLQNPGDGGYQFDSPMYDPTLLNFVGHTHTTANNVSGNFGSDAWEFTAIKSSTSNITITATRPFDKSSTVIMYTAAIVIN